MNDGLHSPLPAVCARDDTVDVAFRYVGQAYGMPFEWVYDGPCLRRVIEPSKTQLGEWEFDIEVSGRPGPIERAILYDQAELDVRFADGRRGRAMLVSVSPDLDQHRCPMKRMMFHGMGVLTDSE